MIALVRGEEWTQVSPPVNPNALIAAVQTILGSGYLSGLGQYLGATGFLGAQYDGAVYVSTNPAASYGSAGAINGAVQGQVVSLISNDSLPPPNTGNQYDKFYCVFMPSTTSFTPGNLGGEHSAATWINPNDNNTYHPYVAWVLSGTLNQMTTVFSHELVETISDPDGKETQISPASSSSWNEIADICGSVAFLDGVAVQSYWSQANGACVIPYNARTDSVFQYPPAGTSLQVIAIKRFFSQDVGKFWIGQIRTLDPSTGKVYDLWRGQAVGLIDTATNSFFVVGGDGSRSTVITAPNGNHRYLTTIPDARWRIICCPCRRSF